MSLVAADQIGRSTYTQIMTKKKIKVVPLIQNLVEQLDVLDEHMDDDQFTTTLAADFRSLKIGISDMKLNHQVINEICSTNFYKLSLDNFLILNTECKSDFAAIFNTILQKTIDTKYYTQILDHILAKDLIDIIIRGCGNEKIFTRCSVMILECTKHPPLLNKMYRDDLMDVFITATSDVNHEKSKSAFMILREIFCEKDEYSRDYMTKHSSTFFRELRRNMSSHNYFLKQSSLQLTKDILFNSLYKESMLKYITSRRNLEKIMDLLIDESVVIQMLAYNIFIIIAAQPKDRMPQEIMDILESDVDQLISFFTDFHSDNHDPAFIEEKSFLIDVLNHLGESMSESTENEEEGSQS
eukprot:TRINITY_DN6472_c2_g1_i1.p1 TRINITY_DN6472_c2_g1~~TRINITY_DN6472_c2_g1_i1.p1  ORF type:complete len:355 (-),score=58.58 TRINITY_DN6472_c2_g1_i1:53-1117(-)